MTPEEVPAEWVEQALNTRLPSGGLPTLNEPQMRAILAAVLPLARAAAWDRGYAASDYEAYHLGTHGRTDNPYRESTARCNCGYGGYHEPENPDCDINKEEA